MVRINVINKFKRKEKKKEKKRKKEKSKTQFILRMRKEVNLL
jgi:hypothetical protein